MKKSPIEKKRVVSPKFALSRRHREMIRVFFVSTRDALRHRFQAAPATLVVAAIRSQQPRLLAHGGLRPKLEREPRSAPLSFFASVSPESVLVFALVTSRGRRAQGDLSLSLSLCVRQATFGRQPGVPKRRRKHGFSNMGGLFALGLGGTMLGAMMF